MKPKNFYDLPDEKRKKVIEKAIEEANEKQKELVDKYENKHFDN